MPNSPRPASPSEAESEILQIIWQEEPCSVRAIHERIVEHRQVGYTTVLKQLQRMLEKGLVDRVPGKGKSYDYVSTQPASETRSTLLDKLTRTVFGNSTNDLVMHALGRKDVSADDIEEIKKFIAGLETDAREKGNG